MKYDSEINWAIALKIILVLVLAGFTGAYFNDTAGKVVAIAGFFALFATK